MITKKTPVIEVTDSIHSAEEIMREVNINNVQGREASFRKIDGEWYILKRELNEVLMLNELIGQRLAVYFSLDTVYYDIAKVDDIYTLMSKNFRDFNHKYFNAQEFMRTRPLPSNLDYLFAVRSNYSEELYSELVKLTVLDFYMQQKDRYGGNLLLKVDKEGNARLTKMFDYEASFEGTSHIYVNALAKINLASRKTKQDLIIDSEFQEQFERLMLIDIEDILRETIYDYELDVSQDSIDYYKDHDRRMKNYVKKYKILR